MKALWKLSVLSLLALTLGACSTQWREADDGLDADQVIDAISAIQKDTSLSDPAAASSFTELLNESAIAIYFATADLQTGRTPLGPPWSVAAIADFSFMGQPDLNALELDAATIAFIDHPASGRAALVVDLAPMGSSNYVTKYFSSSQVPYIQDDEFVAIFGDQLVLKTFDVEDDGALKPVVQFRVYDFDSSGAERFIGKFSTMVGYDG